MREQLIRHATELRAAADQLANSSTEQKNEALQRMADMLERRQDDILAANAEDIQRGEASGMAKSLLDRLRLTPERVRAMAEGLRQVAALDDPVGQVLEEWERPNGMRLQKIAVPLGVVGMIYESRPNVTVDATGLCLKTGNAVMLRGGSDALASNRQLVEVLQEGLRQAGMTDKAVYLVATTDRQAVHEMLQLRGYLDVIIPRGGAGLIQRVVNESKIPVIETGVGNCHLYIARSAPAEMAMALAVNAKTQRPSVCNAIETLLVDKEWAEQHLAELAAQLVEKSVLLKGCPKARELVPSMEAATEEDWDTEYLDLVLAVKLVEDVDEAVAHINRHGTKHSEGIVTADDQEAERFLQTVDAAVVYHNVSTRFSDGFEFGFGAEIGISTQKLHARGPMGLAALTTYKYVVRGHGQIRQ